MGGWRKGEEGVERREGRDEGRRVTPAFVDCASVTIRVIRSSCGGMLPISPRPPAWRGGLPCACMSLIARPISLPLQASE